MNTCQLSKVQPAPRSLDVPHEASYRIQTRARGDKTLGRHSLVLMRNLRALYQIREYSGG